MKINNIIFLNSNQFLNRFKYRCFFAARLFTNFGYPTYIIYPYAVAKILGLIAIWFVANKTVKEWAYAGFFFDFVLAFFAHKMINDGEETGAMVALLFLTVSYIYNRKIN